MTPQTSGWYLDPYERGRFRYFDGMNWTPSSSPVRGSPDLTVPAAHSPQAVAVLPVRTNHALHLLLTLLTFWMFGGWGWVWILVAISNSGKTQTVYR